MRKPGISPGQPELPCIGLSRQRYEKDGHSPVEPWLSQLACTMRDLRPRARIQVANAVSAGLTGDASVSQDICDGRLLHQIEGALFCRWGRGDLGGHRAQPCGCPVHPGFRHRPPERALQGAPPAPTRLNARATTVDGACVRSQLAVRPGAKLGLGI